ncbi:flagellar basal body rod protein FlgB [Paenibacillus sp. JCM 10914]|uniref:flagellar basal body rod protein FlgB n=1 Tax=Paenibacillus sp. JCM 10914 TaxID=1236974 RepID=UPI0003CC82C1|nr:flagellar basal body rod protein FlgB [Paenibacillus sp. JCM 10914]GAE04768.1 flagellar basal-body rod protein FlgB [Paenibacillus sp. JCM 10914]
MNLLNNGSFQRLQSGLNASNLRNTVIANNIANADTPHFKRSEVSFENLLKKEMDGAQLSLRGRRTDPRHFVIGSTGGIPEASVLRDGTSSMNNNENNVDADREMSLLADNQLRYNSYIQAVNEQIRMMRTALEGR